MGYFKMPKDEAKKLRDEGVPCSEIAKLYGIQVGSVYWALHDYDELLERERKNKELFDVCVEKSNDLVDARRKFTVIMNKLERAGLDWRFMTGEACWRTKGIGPYYTEIIFSAKDAWRENWLNNSSYDSCEEW